MVHCQNKVDLFKKLLTFQVITKRVIENWYDAFNWIAINCKMGLERVAESLIFVLIYDLENSLHFNLYELLPKCAP